MLFNIHNTLNHSLTPITARTATQDARINSSTQPPQHVQNVCRTTYHSHYKCCSPGLLQVDAGMRADAACGQMQHTGGSSSRHACACHAARTIVTPLIPVYSKMLFCCRL